MGLNQSIQHEHLLLSRDMEYDNYDSWVVLTK